MRGEFWMKIWYGTTLDSQKYEDSFMHRGKPRAEDGACLRSTRRSLCAQATLKREAAIACGG